jgi:mono/diheme cytochrome c family protein
MYSTIARTLLVVAALAANAVVARAAEVGSVEKGLAFARVQCAECHLIGKEKGLSTNLGAPTFAEIANTPGMTAAALRVTLSTPHESMPNLIVKGEAADSLIAYILSLKDGQ